jgi:hypothetical protein
MVDNIVSAGQPILVAKGQEITVGRTPLDTPGNGYLWVDTDDNPARLKVYDSATAAWKQQMPNALEWLDGRSSEEPFDTGTTHVSRTVVWTSQTFSVNIAAGEGMLVRFSIRSNPNDTKSLSSPVITLLPGPVTIAPINASFSAFQPQIYQISILPFTGLGVVRASGQNPAVYTTLAAAPATVVGLQLSFTGWWVGSKLGPISIYKTLG